MELKEQNWKNFTANHLHDWHGVWTRYSPQSEVQESFQSLRSFQSDPQQLEIAHTNRYIYADGTVKEQSWQYNLETNGLPDGVSHPGIQSMRGLFFESGHAAAVTMQLQVDSLFAVELFFKSNELRHSVAIVYDKEGALFRTANIREDSRGFPSQFWSKEIEQVSQREFSEDWQGNSVTIAPDLKVSQPSPIKFYWNYQGHQTFFLPDEVSISCPEKISIGNPFTLVANWLITPSQLHQLKARYDESGAFAGLTLEQFSR